MIPVQMGAHHIVDLLGLDTEPGEIIDKRTVHAVELRSRRALLVIADAGIDEDGVTAGAHDKAVEAEHQLISSRFEQRRAE